MMMRRTLLAHLLFAFGTGAVLAPAARADTVTTANNFATSRSGTSAVFDGQTGTAYVFGGEGAGGVFTSQIVAFDPVANTMTIKTATLPSARRGTSAVIAGTKAYIFGGRDSTGRLGAILEYDPVGDTLIDTGATLPSPRSATSAIWDGSCAYVFGGTDGTNRLAEIVRYDPSDNSVQVMTATLPTARQATSAVFTGTKAYVFGGDTASGRTAEIVEYDPSNDTASVSPAALPAARSATSAAWVAPALTAYVYGGTDGTLPSAQILKFDPGSATIGVVGSAALPSVRFDTSAVADDVHDEGNHVFVFGGELLGGAKSTRVLDHEVSLGTRTQITYTGATSGPWGTALSVSAHLGDVPNDDPVVGKTLRFTLGSNTVTAMTDSQGNTPTTTLPLPNTPGGATLAVAFPGDPDTRDTSTTVPVTIDKRPAGIVYSGPTAGTERTATLAATLSDQTAGAPLAGVPVVFTLGPASGSAQTAGGTGQATITFQSVPQGNHTATAVFNGNALYFASPTAAAAYYVDWGYTFVDEGGNGTFHMSLLKQTFDFDGPGGDDISETGDGLQIASTGLAGLVSPAPLNVIAVIRHADENLGVVGAFDLQNLQFLAVVGTTGGNTYVLRRTCAGDATTCPQLPTCIFNQSPVSDHVILHNPPFCP